MNNLDLDDDGRFCIDGYAGARPFASFLPGIAGTLGIPLWVFYVNRGQAVASFGVENKDHPIMEFEPAHRAYQTTPTTGFRTFLKLNHGDKDTCYEPFAPWTAGDELRMSIGMNELELRATNTAHGLQTDVLYFTLPGEAFAGLARQVTVTNLADAPLDLEILDGMARVMPYGLNNQVLKEIGRTMEAFMAVYGLEEGLPYYRLQASVGDSAEVGEIQAGHFYLAFDASGQQLIPFVDPVVVFGQDTSLFRPAGFVAEPLGELRQRRQITSGRTPCGFFGTSAHLKSGEAITLYALIGHVSSAEAIQRERARLTQAAYVQQKRQEARQLVEELTDAVASQTALPQLDAYTRQSFLDNMLRGGWPLILGDEAKPAVYHIYSRKHGDLERDYNYFTLAAEPYSQGNANYRDVNQNRRCDVLLAPQLKDFNVLAFMSLIQADGYNPLVVTGSRFTVPAEQQAAILALADPAEKLTAVLARSFTPGELVKTVADQQIRLAIPAEAFVAAALAHAEQHFEATFHEGYWIDHWIYNLDLIDSYLAVYPDRKEQLLFGQLVPFYDSAAIVQPRARKTVLTGNGLVRQYGAVVEDEEKLALIAGRAAYPNLARTAHGQSEVYRTTVFVKLVGLAVIKFATLDPLGMGIEMEAGRPGWYDALNGLPGLFGSSLCESYELQRLLSFLLEAMAQKTQERAVSLPIEQVELMAQIMEALQSWDATDDPDRDYRYWDAASSARETYRERVRLGFDGTEQALSFDELSSTLKAFRTKLKAGIQRAVEMNVDSSAGIPPTYFAYTVTEHAPIRGADGAPVRDAQGRPYVEAKRFAPTVLPLFLEGPVHALKVSGHPTSARELFTRVKASSLYDHKLGMYKVNASLKEQAHEIGRARSFTPGWLENESIWLHMEYKYLLEVLRAGLYPEFFEAFRRAVVCFQPAEVHGRSPLENSSFLVSSAHPDESLHGAGFVARLSGATAEFLSIWTTMTAGQQPFSVQDGRLSFELSPSLPGWLFDADGRLSFTLVGSVRVTYHNPGRRDLFRGSGVTARAIVLQPVGRPQIELEGGTISEPYAEMVRAGQIAEIDVYLRADSEA